MCFHFLFSTSNTFSFIIFISWSYLFFYVDSISFFFVLPTHFMEKGLATHSSILVWRIPDSCSLAGYNSAKSDTTEAT